MIRALLLDVLRPILRPGRALCAGLLPFAVLAAVWPAAARAQDNDDTRLRLNQTVERKAADRETDLLKGAEDNSTLPSTLVIDGKAYSVSNNVS